MKRHASILAGTAVGLVMATAPLAQAGALASTRPMPAAEPQVQTFILVQAEPEDEEDEENRKRRQRREAPVDEAPSERAPVGQSGERAPTGEAQPEQAQPEQAQPEPRSEQEAEERPAESGATPRAEQPASRGEAAPDEEPAPEAAPMTEPETQAQPEAAPAEREVPADEQVPEVAPDEPATDSPAEQPAGEQPDQGEPEPRTAEPPADAGEATEPGEGDEAPAEARPKDTPEDGAPEPEPRPQAPAADGEVAPDAAPAAPGVRQGDGEAEHPEGTQDEVEQPEAAAPVLDSQKEQPGSGEAEDGDRPASGDQPADAERPAGEASAPAGQTTEQPAEAVPPPADDSAAQDTLRPVELQPVTAEEGRRIERRPEDTRRERPEGAEIVREIGDRIVIRIDNRVIVESNDRPRIARGARDVYYEELPRGRIREVIVRENGVLIVTIRDRYGDVIRRSRISPDGREYVLVYVADDDYERVRDWRDPGRDLPAMRLTIPIEEYILDARRVEDPELYYTFLDQPPVERVERLYSIDEVKRSARIRDKTRRVELDTITFEFGSASIAESEIGRLEGVARAMERLLEENPAETFLVEGHTDAVGSDIANLALSDRRAEAVADALTNVFAIPPENLATQGYGEQYLKVRTEEPERENRRVAIRRITPLIAPVAAAQ